MTGRCTTDPLDPADDICVFCGQGYCESCLIRPHQGRGEPVCKACARANSGIKGARVPGSRPSKSELKRAREELEEYKLHRPPPTFQFFTDAPDFDASAFENASESAPSADRRKIRLGIGRRRSDDVDDVGSGDELDTRPVAPANTPAVSVPAEASNDNAPVPPAPTGDALADRLNSARSATLPGGSATEQLMRLRSEGVSPASDAPSDDEVYEEPPAPAWSIAVSSRPTDRREPPPAHLTGWAPAAPTTTPVAPTHVDPFALGDPFALAGATSTPTPAVAARPPTAPPMAPVAPTAPPAPLPQATTTASAPVHRPAAPEPGPAPMPAAAPSADRDAAGNWIPPILRGIAPDAQQRAGELPRRRSAG